MVQNNAIRWLSDFSSESEQARELVNNKPELWEYLLTAELIESRLASLNTGYSQAEASLVRGTVVLSEKAYWQWFQEKIEEAAQISRQFGAGVTEGLVRSWGKRGDPADAMAILQAATGISDCCRRMIVWELELRSEGAPAKFITLGLSLRGFAGTFLNELARMCQEIRTAVKRAQSSPETQKIRIVLTTPPLPEVLLRELDALKNDP